MTVFAIICAVMLAAALLWVMAPLLRPQASVDSAGDSAVDPAATRTERRASSVVLALSVSGLAIAMYLGLTTWDWQAAQKQAESDANVEAMLQQLEAKLASSPQDVDGWLLLGRSYTSLGRYAPAVDAFQHAYDLTKGENVDAILGLGEALVLVDEASLTGRAGQLFESALKHAPTQPKALWYGSMVALQAGDLRTGRDRLQLLLAQNPPQELRSVLERQIQDLNEQMGEAGQQASQGAVTQSGLTPNEVPKETSGGGVARSAQAALGGSTDKADSAAAVQPRVIRASITIAPQIQQQLREPLTLFVLARDPAAGGPPLAVQRRSSADIPLTIELSEGDAMMPTHTIASVPRVQVVARLSRAGVPQAGSGDFYGEADYDFSKDTGTLQIVIDRTVP